MVALIKQRHCVFLIMDLVQVGLLDACRLFALDAERSVASVGYQASENSLWLGSDSHPNNQAPFQDADSLVESLR
jgi:hypothetical protein